MKIQYHFFKLYLTVTRFLMSFRQRNRIHIGTEVYHIPTGRRMYVSDCNHIQWNTGERLYSLVSPIDRKHIDAVKGEIERMPGFENWLYNATYWWGWYKQNWLDIDAKEMVKGKQPRSIYVVGKDRATAKR